MLRALSVAMIIFVLPLGPARADAPPERDANAALTYWQAFAQLPKFTDAQQNELREKYLTMPLDASAREIVARAALRVANDAPRAQRSLAVTGALITKKGSSSCFLTRKRLEPWRPWPACAPGFASRTATMRAPSRISSTP